jgi:hypothetical protein
MRSGAAAERGVVLRCAWISKYIGVLILDGIVMLVCP